MVKKVTLKLILATGFLFLTIGLKAQTLPVGTPVLEDFYRRQQLLGKIDSSLSFTVRPLFPTKSTNYSNVFDPEHDLETQNWKMVEKKSFANGKGEFQLLPVSWQQQFNSDHPYGWNDGPMIPSKGYQTVFSTGFYARYGPLSIQLRPEYVFAANPSFNGFDSGHNDYDLFNYYEANFRIDAPERFGTSAYSKAYLGQSAIRLNVGAFSLGLSTENIWWGPGVRNALILTNNAPGFAHVTFNTTKPVKTFLGSFEWQVIGARLNNSGYTPLITTVNSNGANLFIPKRDDWRYYTGFNLVYQPRWVPGLFLGLIRSFNAYESDISGLNNYLPFFVSYTKASIGNSGDPIARDQVTSVYSRWLFTKAHAEIYFEYGLNDNSYNRTDFAGSPQHSRAYIIGIRKLVPLNNNWGGNIMFNGEITQLSQTVDRYVRDAGGWYVHSEVRQGMTNDGQIIGAGTGTGGNLQSVDVSWVKGLKKLGILFERYEHNVDFSNVYFSQDINGNSRKWVDFGFGFQGDWNYKNLLFNAKLEGVQSVNYEWLLKNYQPTLSYQPNNNVFNLHAQVGVSYRF
ncbi:capsule assembly Wzi family protein [Mucilaginibacter ginkgonis]|uniref:Capsule assembly protein Wzi n=1 Tax=Mucilaginibacter ginkgonis TaxID=2682091 RepID=A0A6I4I289_9SPHI|nr:capsule assembly Wzi family protein [Mucilaginibacter ginkgonis]QQL50864.1 hypothetical protein GO620_005240 [Mucilaginibacter ginkgonis]